MSRSAGSPHYLLDKPTRGNYSQAVLGGVVQRVINELAPDVLSPVGRRDKREVVVERVVRNTAIGQERLLAV